jgi:hypothetical protein
LELEGAPPLPVAEEDEDVDDEVVEMDEDEDTDEEIVEMEEEEEPEAIAEPA